MAYGLVDFLTSRGFQSWDYVFHILKNPSPQAFSLLGLLNLEIWSARLLFLVLQYSYAQKPGEIQVDSPLKKRLFEFVFANSNTLFYFIEIFNIDFLRPIWYFCG